MNLVEMFSSVQGEGLYVGASTLFVRFGECDLRCRWCDSPHTWRPARECKLETKRGAGSFRTLPNPLPLETVLEAGEALELSAHAFVSLTGGEPLLQPDAVGALCRALQNRGPRIHLETHGLAVEALTQVVEQVHLVSMDWKLASDVRRASDSRRGAVAPFHDEHERFLRVARRAPECFVKIVITPESGDAEIEQACTRIEAVDAEIPLVLQPVTPFGQLRERPSAPRMLELAARLGRRLRDVRIIPQTHPIYGAP